LAVTEPTKFFRQHHAVEAPAIDDREFRPGWRVRPKLEQLFIDGAISFAVLRAGMIFRVRAEVVLSQQYPAKWLGVDRGEKNRLGFDMSIVRRRDAIKQLGDLRRKLGGFAIDLLEAHLVDDLDWAELGRRYGVHGKTARTWTIVTLQALAGVLWGKGGHERTLPQLHALPV
jgi:hypothetical protein